LSIQIKQCKDCNRLFHSLGNNLCPDCSEKVDNYFRLVRDYLYANPEADVLEVSKNTGVQESYIFEFLREERLSLNKDSEYIKCEQCGSAINSGKLCNSCKERLSRILETAAAPAAASKEKAQQQKESFGRGLGKVHLKYGSD